MVNEVRRETRLDRQTLAGWLAGWLGCLPREHLAEEGAQEGPQEHLRVRRAHLIHAIVWCDVV